MITLIDELRLNAAKRAFSVRNVPLPALRMVDDRPRQPQPGDIVLAQVVEPGRLSKLQTTHGRKAELYPGDEIIVVYGDRYAPDAYEADCPRNLGLCDLAAAGGLAAKVRETNFRFASEKSPPTLLKPVGLFVDADEEPLNLSDFPAETAPLEQRDIPVICVFGASMNAGKTTMAGGLIKGLTAQGLKVGAAKVTGTCSGGDLFTFLDAGAIRAVDFTDVGLATTYRAGMDRIIAGARALIGALQAEACDVAILEIADGVFQEETRALLNDHSFRELVDHWTFAADSAPSILTGLDMARALGLDIAAVSGSVTASPLAMREASGLVKAPLLTLPQLWEGVEAMEWLQHQPRPAVSVLARATPPVPQALAS